MADFGDAQWPLEIAGQTRDEERLFGSEWWLGGACFVKAFFGGKEVPHAHCVRLRNGATRTGTKREKMGGGDGVTGNGATLPAAHLFPLPLPEARTIPLPTSGGGGTSISTASGFGPGQLERARAFYRLYPIASALRTQLNWVNTGLIQIEVPDKKEVDTVKKLAKGKKGKKKKSSP